MNLKKRVLVFLRFCVENDYDSETILVDLNNEDYGPFDDRKESNLFPVLDENKFLVKKHLGRNRNDDDEIPQFSFGEIQWYFWSYFKDWGNFNVAKYKNLKEECLNNGIHKMSMKRFNQILVESIMFSNTKKGRSIKAMDSGGTNDQYNILSNLPLSASHIIVLVMYCSETILQYELFNEHFGGNRNDDDEIPEFSFGENIW